MKDLELILWSIMIVFVMSFLMAIYQVVNKKATPLEMLIMITGGIYTIIHIYNNWV